MDKKFNNKKVLIAGKGISGQGAEAALKKFGAECKFTSDLNNLSEFGAELIVVSPGIPTDNPIFTYAEENNISIFGEIELGYILNDKHIIAVTGTNGKTTVTGLIGEILKREGYKTEVCGNIGKSFAETAAMSEYDYAVLEVSSFQLETVVDFKPHIAVITNISQDHLNRHKTMRAYCDAKLKIAANQTQDDFLILSQDDIPLYALENFAPRSQVFFTSVCEKVYGAYILGDRIWFDGECICKTDRVRLEGEHNLKNVLSAVCAAKLMGIRNECIVAALTEFSSDLHRLRLVARIRGKNYYNDSKGTNIMASVRAAECMSGSTCMIVGGSDKGYEYDELFKSLPDCVVRVAAVGATAEKIARAASRSRFGNIKEFDDFTKAFEWAAGGDEENVLLSPASASFDMFSSYAERGETFERLVKNAAEK